MPAQQLESTGWDARAACKGMPTQAFFIEHGQAPLKAVCRRCEVRWECLQAAFQEERGHGRNYGIRGGYTANERYRFLKALD